MATETVLAIRRAEEEAKKIRAEATAKAAALIKDAEEKSRHAESEAEDGTRAELRDTLEKIRAKADGIAESGLDSARADAAKIAKTADENMRTAVKKIVWEIMEKCR